MSRTERIFVTITDSNRNGGIDGDDAVTVRRLSKETFTRTGEWSNTSEAIDRFTRYGPCEMTLREFLNPRPGNFVSRIPAGLRQGRLNELSTYYPVNRNLLRASSVYGERATQAGVEYILGLQPDYTIHRLPSSDPLNSAFGVSNNYGFAQPTFEEPCPFSNWTGTPRGDYTLSRLPTCEVVQGPQTCEGINIPVSTPASSTTARPATRPARTTASRGPAAAPAERVRVVEVPVIVPVPTGPASDGGSSGSRQYFF